MNKVLSIMFKVFLLLSAEQTINYRKLNESTRRKMLEIVSIRWDYSFHIKVHSSENISPGER